MSILSIGLDGKLSIATVLGYWQLWKCAHIVYQEDMNS